MVRIGGCVGHAYVPSHCEANSNTDDPELWKTQPVTVQIVGRPFRDEVLLAHGELIDSTVNARKAAPVRVISKSEREVARL